MYDVGMDKIRPYKARIVALFAATKTAEDNIKPELHEMQNLDLVEEGRDQQPCSSREIVVEKL